MGAKNVGGYKMITAFVSKVFPEADKQLDKWRKAASAIPDKTLSAQALASIKHKRFHALGGSAYALFPGVNLSNAVKFIVALQTISDYLDNLCDRAGVYDAQAFSQLHLSILNAVDTESETGDYYMFYPYKDDGSYLQNLVDECRQCLQQLPSYPTVREHMKFYALLYSDLQTFKHLAPDIRERQLFSWADSFLHDYPGIYSWEFCAATGSTLAIFALYAAASREDLSPPDAAKIASAYFPWICSLHILLDYYIDHQEDYISGDLNFTSYYSNLKECRERLLYLANKSMDAGRSLEHPEFHSTIVNGLLAMYLSDPKAQLGMNKLATGEILASSSPSARRYYRVCRLLRSLRIL